MIVESLRPPAASEKPARPNVCACGGCNATEPWQQRFERLLPSIRCHAEVSFRHRKPEEREELVQECIVRALVDYARLVERDREHVAFAVPLSRYAVRQVRRGRRVAGRRNGRDGLAANGRPRTRVPIDLLADSPPLPSAWLEALTDQRRSDPAAIAAARLDIRQWLATLSKRNRLLAERLAAGERTSAVAKTFAITAGRVAQLRRELERSWFNFQRQAYQL
jgi:DNA-directed RNA polymerase specialized sigma24 family protein